MQSNYKYYLKQPLVANKASYVVMKDEQGIPRGEFNAYYRPEKDSVDLYTRKKSFNYHPKHTVSIYALIRDY